MRTRLFLAIASLFACAAPLCSQDCRLVIREVNAHAFPISSALLGADKDPWDSYLQISYFNQAPKKIVAVKFGVEFVDALADTQRSVYDYTASEPVKPGKQSRPYWGDGVYYDRIGPRIEAAAWVKKIRYEDGTFWEDDGSRKCGTAPQIGPARTLSPAIPVNAQNLNTDAAKAEVARQGHRLTGQEMADAIRAGRASKFRVSTEPAGAKILIDGNDAGVSPFLCILSKHDDAPRAITIVMPGFKRVLKVIDPNGDDVSLSIALEKED